MQDDRAQLELLRDRSTLRALVQHFSGAIASGLAADGQPIKALRAFLRPPPPPPAGASVAVIDVGGTNCRAALLTSEAGHFRLAAEPVSRPLPVRREASLSAASFFGFQAELLATLVDRPGLPVGYCFSYPAEVQSDLDARLIRWTKGLRVPGVVGQPVGALLRAALDRRGLAPAGVVVLNDTVACLLGAAQAAGGVPHQAIGLIAGTGTNMAGFFASARAPKLSGTSGPLAINLESGNYCPLPRLLTAADDRVDARDRPGAQRFEKAAAGHYLPYVAAELLARAGPTAAAIDPEAGCGPLVALMNRASTPAAVRQLVQALFERSADLIAAGLAALLEHYEAGCVTIVAEGALFWRTPGYAARVGETLTALVGAERFTLRALEHVNLIGAASAALQAA